MGFLGLKWSTCVAMFVVLVLMLIEWRFQLWTAEGDIITMYRKPEHSSWLSTNAVGQSDRKHEIQVRDKE